MWDTLVLGSCQTTGAVGSNPLLFGNGLATEGGIDTGITESTNSHIVPSV